ncbi:MAG: helix-turn-helix domain-containing protein [Gemmatimonadota bacterium]
MRNKKTDVMYLDREQMRLLADPIRQRVLKLLGQKEMSTSGLVDALGEQAPGNLYYHVHRLLSAGLIRLVRTEPRRGTVEKFYEAVARVFTVKPELVVTMGRDQPLQDDLVTAARSVVDATLHQFATSVARGLFSESVHRVPPVVAGITIRGSEDRLRDVGARLRRWIADVSRDEDESAGIEYTGLVMFFPTELGPPAAATPATDSDAE